MSAPKRFAVAGALKIINSGSLTAQTIQATTCLNQPNMTVSTTSGGSTVLTTTSYGKIVNLAGGGLAVTMPTSNQVPGGVITFAAAGSGSATVTFPAGSTVRYTRYTGGTTPAGAASATATGDPPVMTFSDCSQLGAYAKVITVTASWYIVFTYSATSIITFS